MTHRRTAPLYSLLVITPLLSFFTATAAEKPQRVPVAEDHSLTTSEYVKLGVPNPDKIWSPADFRAATPVLEKLSEKEASELPRLESRKSSHVFRRLSSPANLLLLNESRAPLARRLQLALDYLGATNGVFKVYVNATNNTGAAFDAELIALFELMLNQTPSLAKMIDQYVPTLSKTAPDYAARMAGLDQAKKGFEQTFEGAIITLGESNAYRTDQLLKLVESLQKILPSFWPRFDATTRSRMKQELIKVHDGETSPKLKADEAALARSLPL